MAVPCHKPDTFSCVDRKPDVIEYDLSAVYLGEVTDLYHADILTDEHN
jgi:hypothetical protein